MRFNKFVGTMAAATISLSAMTGIANAQQVNFAGITGVGSTVFTYGNATGLSVTTTPASQFIAQDIFPPANVNFPASMSFTPPSLQNVGFLVAGGSPGEFVQQLTGGGFTITDTASSTVLLTGTFTTAFMSGTVGNSNGGFRVAVGDVNYTGGVYFTSTGLANPGEFSFDLTAVNPTFSVGPGPRFNSFQSGGAGTFSATAVAVPEPSEWVAMGMAATSVGGLMFRAKLKLRTKRQQVAA